MADDETGEVFLVAGQGLQDLLRPKSRFMERSLHAFKTKEIARVRLRAGQREKELVQRVSEEGKELGWADSRSPEEAKDLYRNWIRKLFDPASHRLRRHAGRRRGWRVCRSRRLLTGAESYLLQPEQGDRIPDLVQRGRDG